MAAVSTYAVGPCIPPQATRVMSAGTASSHSRSTTLPTVRSDHLTTATLPSGCTTRAGRASIATSVRWRLVKYMHINRYGGDRNVCRYKRNKSMSSHRYNFTYAGRHSCSLHILDSVLDHRYQNHYGHGKQYPCRLNGGIIVGGICAFGNNRCTISESAVMEVGTTVTHPRRR